MYLRPNNCFHKFYGIKNPSPQWPEKCQFSSYLVVALTHRCMERPLQKYPRNGALKIPCKKITGMVDGRSPAKISQEWCMEGQLQKYLILCSCQSTTLQLEAIQVSDVKKISHAIHLPNLNHTAGVMYWKSSIKISYFEIVITIEQKTWSPFRGNCCFNVT